MKKLALIILYTLFWTCAFAQSGTMNSPKKVKKALFWYEKYESKAVLNFPVKDFHKSLRVYAGAGSLEINNHNKNVVEVEAQVLLTSNKQKKAQEFIEKFCELAFVEEGTQITFKSFFDPSVRVESNNGTIERHSFGSYLRTPGAKINLKIKIPKQLKLRISDDEGDIVVSDLENEIYIGDGSGDIILNNLSGYVKIKDYTGDIRIDNIQNKLKIIDEGGDIFVKNVGDSLYIKDGVGDIKAENIKTHFKIIDEGGDITAKNIEANLDIKDGVGDIVVESVKGNLTIRDEGGDITAKNIEANLDIKDGVGDIHLHNIAPRLLEEATAKIRDEGGDIYLKKVRSKLILRNERGKVVRSE